MNVFVVAERKPGVPSHVTTALGILSGLLEKEAADIYVFDNNGEEAFDTEAILESCPFVPDSLFLSIVTLNALRSYNLLDEAKRRWPHLIVVGGGVHMRFNYMEAFEKGVHIVVRHEIEPVFAALMTALQQGDFPCLLQEPAYADPENFSLPDWRYLESKNYSHVGSYLNNVLSSRGCAFRCNFCADEWTTNFRNGSLGQLEKYLNCAAQYGKNINILDSNFLLDRNRSEEFCDLILNGELQGRGLRFFLQTHIHSPFDANLLERLRKAGVDTISFGLERLTSDAQKLIDKNCRLDLALEKIKLCLDNGIKVGTNLLIGFPFETAALLEKEIEYFVRVRDLGAMVTPFLLLPFPGTTYYDDYPETHGWYLDKEFFLDFEKYKNTLFYKHFDKGAIGLGWNLFWRNVYGFDVATSSLIVETAQEFGDLRRIPIRKTLVAS